MKKNRLLMLLLIFVFGLALSSVQLAAQSGPLLDCLRQSEDKYNRARETCQSWWFKLLNTVNGGAGVLACLQAAITTYNSDMGICVVYYGGGGGGGGGGHDWWYTDEWWRAYLV